MRSSGIPQLRINFWISEFCRRRPSWIPWSGHRHIPRSSYRPHNIDTVKMRIFPRPGPDWKPHDSSRWTARNLSLSVQCDRLLKSISVFCSEGKQILYIRGWERQVKFLQNANCWFLLLLQDIPGIPRMSLLITPNEVNHEDEALSDVLVPVVHSVLHVSLQQDYWSKK